ncbi:hypothetical protein NL676_000091 [Syzygium grande]|nr:hypothetical protein NL676_000091 [Syzygium grande]
MSNGFNSTAVKRCAGLSFNSLKSMMGTSAVSGDRFGRCDDGTTERFGTWAKTLPPLALSRTPGTALHASAPRPPLPRRASIDPGIVKWERKVVLVVILVLDSGCC